MTFFHDASPTVRIVAVVLLVSAPVAAIAAMSF